MFQVGRDLVFEFLAVDRFAAATGASWISRLQHEGGDYAVEEDVAVVAALDEGAEVFAGLGRGISGV